MTTDSPSLLRGLRYSAIHYLLALLWLVAGVGGILSLLLRIENFSILSGLGSFLFILLLTVVLARRKPSATDLPDLEFLLTPPLGFGAASLVLVVGLAILFVFGLMIGPAVSSMLLSALLGLGITLAWRNRLTKRTLVYGVAAGLISGAGTAFLGNGDLSWAIFNLVVIPPVFTAGALLIGRTSLARFRLLEGQTISGLRGFLWACVLAVPASMLNLLGNIQAGDNWVIHWWQPFYALVPGIAEETWARLFLTTLIYALLRPATNRHPRRAMFLAVLVGALLHGFSHTGIDPFGLLIGSLLYGIPAALLFIKYDFEHAAGYHFMVDFVRYGAALLGL